MLPLESANLLLALLDFETEPVADLLEIVPFTEPATPKLLKALSVACNELLCELRKILLDAVDVRKCTWF